MFAISVNVKVNLPLFVRCDYLFDIPVLLRKFEQLLWSHITPDASVFFGIATHGDLVMSLVFETLCLYSL